MIGKRGNKKNLKTNLIIGKVDGKEFLGYRDSNGRFFDNGLSQILLNETLFPETFQGKNDNSTEKEEKEFIEVIKKKLIEKKYKIIEFEFERKQVIIVQELDNEYLIIAVQTNEIIENNQLNSSDEAVEALMALGYTLADASEALKNIDTDLSTAERVTKALRQ